jgi:hypothetical protein
MTKGPQKARKLRLRQGDEAALVSHILGGFHARLSRRSRSPLGERPEDLREDQPPGGVTGEVIEALADHAAADLVAATPVAALEATALRATTLVAKAPVAEALVAEALVAKAPAAETPVATTPEAATTHPTKTQTIHLGHKGTEVALRPHDRQQPRQGTTGSSSTPPGGELRPHDHHREPPGKGFQTRATTRFANAYTKPLRMRLMTS